MFTHMKKNFIIFLLSLFIFAACATIGDMMQADKNIRKVELGMSKKTDRIHYG